MMYVFRSWAFLYYSLEVLDSSHLVPAKIGDLATVRYVYFGADRRVTVLTSSKPVTQ